MTIAKYLVKKIMADSGSSADMLFYDTFVRMNLSPNLLKLNFAHLVDFTRYSVGVEGRDHPADHGENPILIENSLNDFYCRPPVVGL